MFKHSIYGATSGTMVVAQGCEEAGLFPHRGEMSLMTDDCLLKMMEASKILQPSGKAGCGEHIGAGPVSLTESNAELPTTDKSLYE